MFKTPRVMGETILRELSERATLWFQFVMLKKSYYHMNKLASAMCILLLRSSAAIDPIFTVGW